MSNNQCSFKNMCVACLVAQPVASRHAVGILCAVGFAVLLLHSLHVYSSIIDARCGDNNNKRTCALKLVYNLLYTSMTGKYHQRYCKCTMTKSIRYFNVRAIILMDV